MNPRVVHFYFPIFGTLFIPIDSDDDVVAGWVENPYWQYLSGMQFFEHDPPIDSSSMTRWRKRIGEAGAEELLKETIAAGLKLKAVKPHQLKRVNVDTTVQEKDIRFPTDTRLYHRARQRLVDAAKQREIPLTAMPNIFFSSKAVMPMAAR